MIVAVKLGKRPDQDSEIAAATDGYDSFGFMFKQVDDAIAQKLGYPPGIEGLIVTQIKPESPGAQSGVRIGDLLIELNHQKITKVSDYFAFIEKLKKEDLAQLLFRRGNSQVFVVQFGKNK